MKQIGNVLISDEVWEKRFSCDLASCKGNCCRYGDLGAPISYDEEITIERNLQKLKKFLIPENFQFLQDGISETHKDSIHIREIAQDTPCPLTYCDSNGVLLCSLHSYAIEQKIELLKIKPFWCSLFPLIIKPQAGFWSINCHIPDFCCSKKDPTPLLISFSDLLPDFFGEEWMTQVFLEYGLKAPKKRRHRVPVNS